MIKKISVSLLLFTSIVFNSYSVQVVKVSTLSDLALKPKVIKYMQHNGRRSVRFEPKNDTNELEVIKVRAIDALSLAELCLFESKENYEDNHQEVEKVICDWVDKVMLSKHLNERSATMVDEKTFANEYSNMVLEEMDKLEGNFNNARIVRIDTLSDLVLMPEIIRYIKANGRDSVLFKHTDRFATNGLLAKAKAMSILSKEDICFFESEKTYEANKEEANNVILKWAEKFISLNKPGQRCEFGVVFVRALEEAQKLEENFKKIRE